MARSDHQPNMKPVERPARSQEEMREMCHEVVAVVLATETAATPLVVQFDEPDRKPVTCVAERDGSPLARPLQLFEGEPAVAYAIRAACRAQVGMAYVLTVPELSQEVRSISYSVKRRKFDPDVEVLEVDAPALSERTRQSGDVELFDVGYGLLEVAHALAGQGLGRFDAAIVMRSDMVRITADHIFELCEDFRKHPGCDVVASWISWLRRPPYLFATDYLDRLVGEAEAGRTMQSDALAAVPWVNTRDHVFGEEKLAANDAVPQSVESYFRDAPMAALQAVELAKYARTHEGEPLYSPNAPQSLSGPVQPKPIERADRALVNRALEVLDWADGLDEAEREELAWADAFGMRNRRDFPLLNDRAHAGKLAYLDSAATTQRVDVALQAQRDFDVHENANVYRGGYPLSAQATFTFNDARAKVERFIGAERRSVVFTANTTAAANLVAQAWGERNVGEGDVIVTTVAEHHSAMMPFLMLAERKGAEVVFIPYDAAGRIDAQAYATALGRKPKLVSFAQIGNVFGIEAPVAEMVREAHAAGARVLVDAAQAFPHVSIDVGALGADWVAFSGHKAYGPMGIGGLWISPEAFDEMDPLAGGGGVVSHVSTDSYYLRPAAIQYEPGTPPVSQAVGFAAALGYLDALGMENVARHAAILTRYAVAGLERIDGVTVVGDHTQSDGQNGLVSFTVRSVAPAQVAAFLGKLGVAIRSGGHCALPLHAALGRIGTGRISIGVHTTRADLDAAFIAIDSCRRAYEAR